MVRAPCCEKMGLKKGPWTSEEDQILVNYINLNGHSNWRALPKLAGLSRCGKSCRLRWINYLRPDLKRGNFSREEEDAIINLHHKLGNRWSAIAAKFPGRTDNEIKNVWHTHLKKRVTSTSSSSTSVPTNHNNQKKIEEEEEEECMMTDKTATAVTDDCEWNINNILPQADESFWSEVLSGDNSDVTSVNIDQLDSPLRQYSPVSDIMTSPSSQLPSSYFPCNFWEALNNEDNNSGDTTTITTVDSPQISSTSSVFPEVDMSNVWPAYNNQIYQEHSSAAEVDQDYYSFCINDDDMVFWYNVFTRPEELPENI